MSDLATRLATVRQRMAVAAERAGVAPEAVQLVAVTKYSSDERLRELYGELAAVELVPERPHGLRVRLRLPRRFA